MKILSKSILLLICAARIFGAEPTSPPLSLLKDHGLRAGPPGKVLPQNAIVHIQFNQPQRLLENLERLVVSTVPERLLPPPLQGLFGTEHPILNMLGMQTIQAPLTADQIAEKVGLATDQPASFTLYPGIPPNSFIFSLPIKNHAPFELFIRNVFNNRELETSTVGGKALVRVRLDRPPFRELFIACSADRVFVSGDRSLLLLLYSNNSFPRLESNPHFAGVFEKAAQEDIWLTFDPALIKPLLSQLQFFEYLPLALVPQHRDKLLAKIPVQQREMIEQRLRLQLGVRSLEEFADYAECVLGATYEELFELLITSLKSFNGITLAVKLDPAFPQFSVSVHSDQYQSGAGTQPIPLEAVRTALARMPGDHHHLTVTGRTPPIEPSVHITSWLKRVRAGFEAKHLKLTFLEALEKVHRDTMRPQSVASQIPWTITTRETVNPIASPGEHTSLQKYFLDLPMLFSHPSTRVVTLVPNSGDDLLEKSLRAKRDALVRNRELVNTTLSHEARGPSFIDTVYRFNPRALPAGVKELTWETAFVTRGGFFGFNQHELVSRKTYFTKTVGEYAVFHQASQDARWISQLQLQGSPRLSQGLAKLLDRVPAGANFFCVHRTLADLPAALEWMQGFEDLVHRDAGAHLTEVRRAADGTGDQADLARKLETVAFSPAVYSVNRDANSGELYSLLPGNLAFPRPKVAPAVLKLFADFNRSAEDVGGSLFYSRVSGGRVEFSLIQSTEAISKLIKTVGNAIHEQYLSGPEKMGELQRLLVSERDQNPKRLHEILLRNPSWEFLPRGNVRIRAKRAKEQAEAHPQHPIAPRDAQTPANLIDLTPHYNASLADSWHAGGITGNDLSSLPQGIQEFAGVKFDVRAVVQLSGQAAAQQSSVKFPTEVKEIKLGQSCGQLHFLHSAGWPSVDGTKIGSILIRYEDGRSEEIPIVYGTHVRDWWTPPGDHPVNGSVVAWKGSNEAATSAQMTLQLYKTTWKNPRPHTPIATLDYVSTMADSAPFLIAITSE